MADVASVVHVSLQELFLQRMLTVTTSADSESAGVVLVPLKTFTQQHLHCSSTIMCCREKQEYEKLEGKIDGLSSNKVALEQQLSQLAGNGEKYEEMLQVSQRLAALVAEIDSQTERWLELADRAEQHSAV